MFSVVFFVLCIVKLSSNYLSAVSYLLCLKILALHRINVEKYAN
jgi:hypothetical protein